MPVWLKAQTALTVKPELRIGKKLHEKVAAAFKMTMTTDFEQVSEVEVNPGIELKLYKAGGFALGGVG